VGSFLDQEPDLPFLGARAVHEMPYGIKYSLELHVVFLFDLARLLHFLRQNLIDERLIRQSLLLSGFAQPTQDLRIQPYRDEFSRFLTHRRPSYPTHTGKLLLGKLRDVGKVNLLLPRNFSFPSNSLASR